MKFLKITFKLESPIHIGFNKAGFVNKTRYYVPGFTFAGAFFVNFANSKNISVQETLEIYENHMYFAPLFFKKGKQIYKPDLINKKIGKRSVYEFEQEFLESYQGISINHEYYSAEEGNLFEFEYIYHPNLTLEGVIGFDESKINENDVKKSLNILRVGAKISKGKGLITLLDINGEKDYLKKVHNSPIDFIALTEELEYKGNVELLTLNRFDSEKGFGQKIVNYGYYLMPGSEILSNCEFEINNYFSLKKAISK